MKIQLASDVHLEFGPISLDNHGADVLVLSGDICVAADLMDVNNEDVLDRFDRSTTIHKFFQECCARFKHVIYIMGNHEHYHGDFATTFNTFKSCKSTVGAISYEWSMISSNMSNPISRIVSTCLGEAMKIGI